jgi:hypothetical protein
MGGKLWPVGCVCRPVGSVEARNGLGLLAPAAGAETGGNELASEAPKLDVGWNGITVLPPKPVGCGASGEGEEGVQEVGAREEEVDREKAVEEEAGAREDGGGGALVARAGSDDSDGPPPADLLPNTNSEATLPIPVIVLVSSGAVPGDVAPLVR